MIEATRLALPEIQTSKDVASGVDAVPNGGNNSCCDPLVDPKLLKERAKKWDKFVSQVRVYLTRTVKSHCSCLWL